MRIRLKGVNVVRKRLADGSKRTYWYAWKGGPPLTGAPGSAEFVASYNAAVARKAASPDGQLLSLLQRYQDSAEWHKLRSSTKRGYIPLIRRIESEFASFPLAAMSDRRTRGVFMAWRDKIAELSGLRQADYAWTVLARVLSWGVNRGVIADNPCKAGGRLYASGARVDKLWTPEDEAAFYARAPAHLHLALTLALWTGQRQGDLLRLPWSAYDGNTIRLKQSKTDRRVTIPVGAPLKAALDATDKCSTIILTTEAGKPWTSDGFRASWRKACHAAGISGVTFNDTRGTAATRLAVAGATEAEIATITGHSLAGVRAVLDTHYLSRDPALAVSAIAKLEKGTKTPTDAQLAYAVPGGRRLSP